MVRGNGVRVVAAALLLAGLAGVLGFVVEILRIVPWQTVQPPVEEILPAEGAAGPDDKEAPLTADVITQAHREDGTHPEPDPSADPVEQATAILEDYLAAELAHDGAQMARYLGGSAAAQGQEDLTVHSKAISGCTVVNATEIDFEVAVQWSAAGSRETETDIETYVLQRTDKGWRIVATPAYP